ncbi:MULTISPECIES: hypothetical protein [unclassified Prochlorococcus]|nr:MULTISPECIES: hypothetical protein [unclassified Prochlorococcus]KGG25601.1 hypothetical protein EV12_2120 [Prochlorococcus sp. MIT 0701]KGG28055.1 hypothetical protein EV13_1682 [Prochlorococcus sp. MIT 0702]KGG34204.1 hypothetical protein EV14_1440 [Prochlorococcus sp. MIT 0703]
MDFPPSQKLLTHLGSTLIEQLSALLTRTFSPLSHEVANMNQQLTTNL